jgi:outer membrane murein-binding lipoprotein Lpp
MKKITKVLMAAVAVSTLCFAGCKNANDLLGEEFIDYLQNFDIDMIQRSF